MCYYSITPAGQDNMIMHIQQTPPTARAQNIVLELYYITVIQFRPRLNRVGCFISVEPGKGLYDGRVWVIDFLCHSIT